MTTAETWSRFRTESENCGSLLNSRLKESWDALHDLLVLQAEAFDRALPLDPSAVHLDTLDGVIGGQAQSLLIEPIENYRRLRPKLEAVEALHDWDRAMEGVLVAMPEFLTMTASEWIAVIGKAEMRFASRARLWWLRKPVHVSFRDNLLYGFQLRRAARTKLEGRLMRLLAESSLELILPWQSVLQVWLPQLSQGHASVGVQKEAAQFRRRLEAYEKRAGEVLKDLNDWSTNNAEKIANRAPLHRDAGHTDEALEKLTGEYFKNHEFWVRQNRAVDAEIDLSVHLATAEREIGKNARELLAGVETEHRSLLEELDQVVTWLQRWKPGDPSAFPPAMAEVISTSNRLKDWSRAVEGALSNVPESIEVTSRIAVRPGWGRSFRNQSARTVLHDTMKRQSDIVLRDGLEKLERQHRTMVREIERAREVVTFSAEAAQTGDAAGLQIEREGIGNARSLLEFHRTQTHDIPPEVEKSVVDALSAGFWRAHTQLEAGQFGVARQAARYGLPAAGRKLALRGVEDLREAARMAVRSLTALYRETLIRIGWIPSPTARIPHVIARQYLSQTLGAESHLEQLPMIYQRLFRLMPVEDPRFLIGRQEELNALAEARALWEHNREAGVIVVGERGSGKTSLLNCAVQSHLGGLEIIRADFSERLTRTEDMHEFLGKLLGVDPKDVEGTLTSGRRVVILEELERAFLRRITHFDALRALLNLISKTSKHTLWIISTNYFAFRLLNASLRLDPHFSHRINAMAVDRDNLREALLLRHNFSGLRLQFAPTPRKDAFRQRLLKISGVEPDPEAEFFDALYRESGGVFRTAFALWHRYIDRAEAGVLYMRHPFIPRYDTIIKSLNDLDLFTLAAIMQHGSLTPSEHSIIFQIDTATSTAWLDNLLARELIEPDPGRVGFRVIPEAGEIIRRTLFNRNIG